MKPKQFIAGLAITATTVLNAQQLPNIIYILADDLGYGDLGCYGQTKIETPNIDSLARQGMRFTQFYSGAPVSAPSRCALLTGKHTGHAYIRANNELISRGNVRSHQAMFDNAYLEGQLPMPSYTVTIPKLLKQVGYTTGIVGKWGLGYPSSESTPNKMGFDFFYGYNCQRQAHTYYPPFLYRNENREYLNNKNIIQPGTLLDESADPYNEKSYQKFIQKDYAPDLMLREILSFVDKNQNNPFLLMWTTIVPHLPLQAPKKWVDYYVNKFGNEPPHTGGTGYYPSRYPHATYAANISYLDEQIGLLIKRLKELNLYENTLIIFTSDNGPASSAGLDTPWFQSAAPLKSERGWVKGTLYEGGVRVPLIASWPEKIKPNQISNHVSAAWDIMPTFNEIINIEFETDGISFLPELTGNKQTAHDFLYWEYPANTGSIAVRMSEWKGIVQNINEGNSKMQLYNLYFDPSEQFNIAEQYPEIVSNLNQIIKQSHIRSEVEIFRFIFEK